MYVSHETPDQTHTRLLGVLAAADFRVYDGTFAFVEAPRGDAPPAVHPAALAVVGDDEVWSQLVPVAEGAAEGAAEPFAVFRFHFPPGLDNSGFVGWLATHIKREVGAGVFVVCGQNTGRGGIFDYWGCPAAERERVVSAVRALREKGAV